jgi:protein SCO1/2
VEDSDKPVLLNGQNWNGERMGLEDFEGRVTVVFFGYTYCPDVCPTTLMRMQHLYRELGDRADQVAIVFASVDPHRDTVEKLASYVPAFDERFYGLHLSFDELGAAKESFGLAIQYGQPKDGPGTDSYYYVDHTGSFFLLDREGHLRLTLPPNAKLVDLVADVNTLLGA